MSFLYLPKWVYELLPLLYFIGGMFAAGMSPNLMGTVSGLALAAAGIQIWSQRKRYRQLQASQLGTNDRRHRERMSRIS